MNLTYQATTLHKKIVHFMFLILSCVALIYCVLILSLIFSVIERKQNTLASKDLSSYLNALETDYANTVSSIKESDLLSRDFIRVDGTTFAVRKDEVASYTVLYAR